MSSSSSNSCDANAPRGLVKPFTTNRLVLSIDQGIRNIGVVLFCNGEYMDRRHYGLAESVDVAKHQIGSIFFADGISSQILEDFENHLKMRDASIWVIFETHTGFRVNNLVHIPTALGSALLYKFWHLLGPQMIPEFISVHPKSVLAWMTKVHKFKPSAGGEYDRRKHKKSWTIKFVKKLLRRNESEFWTPDQCDAAINALFVLERNPGLIGPLPPAPSCYSSSSCSFDDNALVGTTPQTPIVIEDDDDDEQVPSLESDFGGIILNDDDALNDAPPIHQSPSRSFDLPD